MTFARPCIEGIGYTVTIRLAYALHGSFFGQILPYKPVDVFIGSAFPGMVRRRKIAYDRGYALYFLIAMEFRSIIEGNGLYHLSMLAYCLDTCCSNLFGCPGRQLFDDDKAGLPFNKRNNAMPSIRTDYGIAFPMTNGRTIVNIRRAL